VVVYLRAVAEPIRSAAGLAPTELFPLLNFGQLGPVMRLIRIELIREAATILMLAAVAFAVAQNASTWLAAFALAFGVWDLSFYASLAATIQWPASLLTWDLLFLLPVPWTAPVLAPSIVAATLTVGGTLALLRPPPAVGWVVRIGILASCVILLVAFMWGWRGVLDGEIPRDFPWMIFALGEGLGIASLVAYLKSGR
jgi:hypothetical protein